MIKITTFMIAVSAALLVLLSYGHPEVATIELVETSSATTSTTTTIDLSFLNTITTTTSATSQNVSDFFECIRWRESHGDYTAVNPTGTFMGAYQIYQAGWDTFAAKIGRHDLVGTPPNTVAPPDQDAVALAMYNELGKKPWGGAC